MNKCAKRVCMFNSTHDADDDSKGDEEIYAPEERANDTKMVI